MFNSKRKVKIEDVQEQELRTFKAKQEHEKQFSILSKMYEEYNLQEGIFPDQKQQQKPNTKSENLDL